MEIPEIYYPLVMTNIAIENCPVEIVDLPIDSMVIFQFVFYMFTRPGMLAYERVTMGNRYISISQGYFDVSNDGWFPIGSLR